MVKNKSNRLGIREYIILALIIGILVSSIATLTGSSIYESGSSSVEPDYLSNLKTEINSDLDNVKRNIANLRGVFEYISYYWLLILGAAGFLVVKKW